jgi:hypothetical protein
MNDSNKADLLRKTTLKKTAMLDALEKCLGVVSYACKLVQIDRASHYRWMIEDVEYKAKVDVIMEMTLDFAENSLYSQIKDGNTTATIFFLKCKGKERGYVEKQEVEHSGSLGITIIDDIQ